MRPRFVFTHVQNIQIEFRHLVCAVLLSSFENITVDKFNYLKSLLTGTAQSLVAGLALTSANYEKAVDLLKQMVISSHIEVLTKLPKVESIGEVKQL